MVETVDILCQRLFVDALIAEGAVAPIRVETLEQSEEQEQRLRFNSVVQVSVFNAIYRVVGRFRQEDGETHGVETERGEIFSAECIVWPDGSYEFDYFAGS
jgi:hypothetical protein